MILSWKKMGKTVIIAEHRLYFLKDIIDRMIYMKDGEIQRIISNEEFNLMDNKSFLNLGIRALSLNNLTKNKKNIFDEINEHNIKNSSKENNIKDSQSKHYFTLKNFKFSYGKMLTIDINSIKFLKMK